MVRILKEVHYEYEGVGYNKYAEYAGLSTDTKPTDNVVTGSTFLEVNTGDVYVFDESGNGTWHKL